MSGHTDGKLRARGQDAAPSADEAKNLPLEGNQGMHAGGVVVARKHAVLACFSFVFERLHTNVYEPDYGSYQRYQHINALVPCKRSHREALSAVESRFHVGGLQHFYY